MKFYMHSVGCNICSAWFLDITILQYQLVFIDTIARPGPIMLFKLPIMLLSNVSNVSLLCPNYAPVCPIMLHYAP